MSLLWFAMAAAASQREKELRNKSRANQKKKNNDDDDSNYSRSESRYLSLYDCVMCEIGEEKSEVAEFFKMLNDEYGNLCKEKKEEYSAEKDILLEKIRKMTPHFDQFKEEMGKKELEVSHNLIEDSRDNYLALTFNDLVQIDARESDHFFDNVQKEYDTFRAQEKQERLAIRELNAEVYLAKKKVNKARFNQKKLVADLKELEAKLKRRKDCYDDYQFDKKLEVLKEILSLDENQKKALLMGIDELISSIDERKKVFEVNTKIYEVSLAKYDSERMTEVMERLTKEGKITENKMLKMFLLLDKIEIQRRTGKYLKRPYYYDSYYRTDSRIAKWFLDKVYKADEDFIEKNMSITDEDSLGDDAFKHR